MPNHNKCNCERLARLVVELMAQEDITQKLVEYYTEIYEEDERTFQRVWEVYGDGLIETHGKLFYMP